MKCPKCSYNQPYRSGMVCGKCKYRFVVDPKRDGYTDGKFATALRRVSKNGTQYFTFHQFYATLFVHRPLFPSGCLAAVLAGAAGAVVYNLSESLFLAAFFAIGAGLLGMFGKRLFPSMAPPENKIRGLWNQWYPKAEKQEHLFLSKPTLITPPATAPEKDIYDYGVEGILIVDEDIYVDLLVKNKLHTEFRLLIIAQSAYPSYLHEQANRLLAERSDLPVYLLHNGVTIVKNMTTKFALKGQKVLDLGLSEQDFVNHKRLHPFQEVAQKPLDLLSTSLIRRILQRATQPTDFDTDSGGPIIIDDDPMEDTTLPTIVLFGGLDDALNGDDDGGGDDFG